MSEAKGSWVRVARRDELKAGEVIGIEAAGHSIAIYDCDGELFATDNICTHAYACLSDGWLDGTTIECPLHAARFDVRSGRVLDPPATENLKIYPIRESGDDIEVKLS